MTVTVKTRHIRIAPRKVRLVADMIRGEGAERAKSLLSFTVNKSAGPLLKLLKSGLTSAKNDLGWDEKNLYISKITIDEAPKLKRWRPRARGSASRIEKKTSHITLVLDQIEKKGETKKKKKDKVVTKKVASLEEIKEDTRLGKKEKEKSARAKKVDKVKETKEKKTKSQVFRRKSI